MSELFCCFCVRVQKYDENALKKLKCLRSFVGSWQSRCAESVSSSITERLIVAIAGMGLLRNSLDCRVQPSWTAPLSGCDNYWQCRKAQKAVLSKGWRVIWKAIRSNKSQSHSWLCSELWAGEHLKSLIYWLHPVKGVQVINVVICFEPNILWVYRRPSCPCEKIRLWLWRSSISSRRTKSGASRYATGSSRPHIRRSLPGTARLPRIWRHTMKRERVVEPGLS